MSKLFSVLSWNVEHFKGEPQRVGRVVDLLQAQKPDVFALFEVEGGDVYRALVETMPGYIFQITEGAQTQEILVGVRRTLTAFITQRVEFRSGTTHMRPGQLVAVRHGGVDHALLFLHLASGTNPRGMGLRDAMLERAFDFRRALDKSAGGRGKARYLFVGDLNTMGMDYPFDRSIEADIELKKCDRYARRVAVGMRRLVKTHDLTWSNGSRSRIPPSNLDHVYASTNLKFRTFTRPDGAAAEVAVRGWVNEADAAKQDAWIARYSDHSMLYFELHD
ncbi:MAG: endonuclease/exonuclease/phosphatase family protein [Rubrivivax sp.]|nr:endonuclease/exonuclease/phosphatase family protein [Rubrivivax sp.]